MKYSYSNLSQYAKCPKAWAALYRDKSVQRGSSPALERGIKLHEELENALVEGRYPEPANMPEGTTKLPDGLWDYLLKLRSYQPSNRVRITPELDYAMDAKGRACQWNDNNALLRGKIDVAIELGGDLQPTKAVHIDWKTGKIRPDPLQADAYAALAWAQGIPETDFRWVYVEQGESRSQQTKGKEAWDRVYNLIQKAEHELEDPVPRQSFFCRFCPVTWCQFNENPEAE